MLLFIFTIFFMCVFFSPLEQFSIFILVPIFFGFIDLSITNFVLFLLFIFICFYFFCNHGIYYSKIIGNNYQIVIEKLYVFLFSILSGSFNLKDSNLYFPFVYTIFVFILFCNIVGMIPYSFTITSHLIVTFFLSLVVFIYFLLIVFVKYRLYFFSHFFPEGSPLWLAPLLVFIEVISYLLRLISLSVRLFANMMSGHVLLKILASFCWIMLCSSNVICVFSFVPYIILLLLMFLELGVAFLQAYVFTVMVIIYIEESTNLH